MQRILLAATPPDRVDVDGVNFFQLNDAIFLDAELECNTFFQAISCAFQRQGTYGRFITPGGIISTAMPYVFGLAGTVLFVMIVWGALEIMLGATDAKKADSGKQRITAAIVGFLILFSAFWIGQIVQIIFGINIGLGGGN